MVSIRDIPAELRWDIAARSATAMSFAYAASFDKAFGDKADEIVRQIWIEGEKEAKGLAEKLALPVKNASEMDETWGLLSLILYSRSAVESLNPRYTQRFESAICSCDLFCWGAACFGDGCVCFHCLSFRDAARGCYARGAQTTLNAGEAWKLGSRMVDGSTGGLQANETDCRQVLY